MRLPKCLKAENIVDVTLAEEAPGDGDVLRPMEFERSGLGVSICADIEKKINPWLCAQIN